MSEIEKSESVVIRVIVSMFITIIMLTISLVILLLEKEDLEHQLSSARSFDHLAAQCIVETNYSHPDWKLEYLECLGRAKRKANCK